MIRGIWQFYIPRLTDCVIGGKASDSLTLQYANPLMKVFGTVDGICRLEFVFDYYGIRYHLFLQENRQVEHCAENVLLNRIVKDLENNYDYEEGTWESLDLFWPFVEEDSLSQEGRTTEKATIQTRFQGKETIKFQLFTNTNGAMSKAFHNERPLYPLSEPIMNPCPKTVRVYAMDEIELLMEVWGNVFKAKIGNDVVCMKAAPADDLRSEIDALMRVPHHPNVIHPLVGVVSAGNGYIDKFLIPFIEGKRLASIREATVDQKEEWKAQLSDAVSSLHKTGLTWGDVAPRNVMIDKKTGEAVLIDLAFSTFDGDDGLEERLLALDFWIAMWCTSRCYARPKQKRLTLCHSRNPEEKIEQLLEWTKETSFFVGRVLATIAGNKQSLKFMNRKIVIAVGRA